MKTRFYPIIICMMCIFIAQHAFASTTKWWNTRWEIRIPIVVNATNTTLQNRPISLPWSSIANKLGNTSVRLSSLRLIANGKPIPFQIDSRDADGHYITGSMKLGRYDRLVFVAPTRYKTDYFLYMSQKPMPPATFTSSVQVKALRDTQAHQRLSSAGLSIDIQGPPPLDASANPPADYAKGTVTGMTLQGKSLTGQSNNWSVFMNGHPFPTDPMNPWQAAKLIVNGPVHKVVGIRCPNSKTTSADGTTIMQAAVTRYFSMFSNVSAYEVEDIIQCSSAQGDWTGVYIDRLYLGHRPNINDTLWDGSSGTPKRHTLSSDSIPHNSSGNFDTTGELIISQKTINGWYGWFDEKAKNGIAVFYGSEPTNTVQPAGIGFRSGWAVWSMENWMTFSYTGLKAPANLRHRFRIIGINATTPELVNNEYEMWKSMSAFVSIGKIQRRK